MDWNGETLALVALVGVIAYAMLSGVAQRVGITLPMAFVALGFSLSAPLETFGSTHDLPHIMRLASEISLVIILFADASHVRLNRIRKFWYLPARMLCIGLPLAFLLGAATVYFVSPSNGLSMALLTAALLTPTDAALGQSFVSDPDVPPYVSETINVESGLNDGLVLPIVLVGAVLAAGTLEQSGITLRGFVFQLAAAPFVGAFVGWAVARLLDLAQDVGWVQEATQGVVFLTTSFSVFLLAETVGVNGFVATFVAGMAFGNTYRHDPHFIQEFMEGIGQTILMVAFLIFGAFLLPAGLAHVSLGAVTVALLFLTIVRIGPIWLSLIGTNLNAKEKLTLGWFGPRGIASVLFTLIVTEEYDFPHENELLACVAMTVALSILMHGVFSSALAKQLGTKAG